MIQGMSARILERIGRCKTYKGKYAHKLFRNSAMVCSVMISEKDVFVTVWTFKPVTIREFLTIGEIMQEFENANTGKKNIYISHSNLAFA